MEYFKEHPFELERFFAIYEFSAPHLLCCSDCEPLSVDDVLKLEGPGARAEFEQLSLGYTESTGLPALREAVAGYYNSETTPGREAHAKFIDPNGVLIGAPQELIMIGLSGIIDRGDHVIATWPGYQSLYDTARAAGAEVTLIDVTAPNFDLPTALEAVLRPTTKLVVINAPHNPTGYLPTQVRIFLSHYSLLLPFLGVCLHSIYLQAIMLIPQPTDI